MKKFSFKLVLLGDESVGKTSLVHRYVNDTFSEKYISTIGADFLLKDITLFDKSIRLMIWDLGGQQYWESFRARYMLGADGCILVFDVSRNEDIRDYINRWLTEVENVVRKKIPVIVVGNKIDLEPALDLWEIAQLVTKLNYPYMETSAKTGNRVEAMFHRIAEEVIKNKIETLK